MRWQLAIYARQEEKTAADAEGAILSVAGETQSQMKFDGHAIAGGANGF
jgi:hypothetical protein